MVTDSQLNTQPSISSEHRFDATNLSSEYRERFAFATEAAEIGYWFCDLPFDKLVWDARVREHFWLGPDVDVDIDLFYARLHPADREATRAAIERSIQTQTQYNVEYRTVSSEGEIKWIRAIGRTAYSSSGTPIRFDGVTRDVTALKTAEEARDRSHEALVRSEKLAVIGRLAATLAHEINNPLSAVGDCLYLAQQSATDSATSEYVTKAFDELRRVSKIVSDTLRFSRNTVKPSHERISDLVESALTLYEGRLRHSGIQIQRDYDDADTVECHGSELRQVFANLIVNAIDALALNGTLILHTRRQRHPRSNDEGVSVSIADTGHGMNRDTVERLFEPFATTKGDSGTGLGLWVSRQILEKHSATIRFRTSQRPNRSGTVFSIWIPVRAVGESHVTSGQNTADPR